VRVSTERSRARLRDARHRLHRGLLLEAAEHCFAKNGIDDTKMEEISRESGLSLATIYELFPGKASLALAVHEVRLAELIERTIGASRGAAGPFEALRAGVRAAAQHFMLHPNYLRMHLRDGHAWGVGDAITTRPKAIASSWGEAIAWMIPIFEEGIRRGDFFADPPALMARRANALVQVQMASWLEEPEARSEERTLEDLDEQLRRAFCAREPAAAPARARRAAAARRRRRDARRG
jgi:AcrR family transcriptional regulator